MHLIKIKKQKSRAAAFSLIELLIVVVILSSLAAIVVQSFSDSRSNSNTAAADQNIRILQNAIDRYHADHGFYPGLSTWGKVCAGANINYGGGDKALSMLRNRLVLYTNVEGRMCESRKDDAGAMYPLGPYISKQLPINPINGSRRVHASATAPDSGTNLTAYGWVYSYETGSIQLASDW